MKRTNKKNEIIIGLAALLVLVVAIVYLSVNKINSISKLPTVVIPTPEAAITLAPVDVVDVNIPTAGDDFVLIEQGQDDINVIPDKYNTGCKGELTVVDCAVNINGVTFKYGSDTLSVNVQYANNKMDGIYVFENYDFSNNYFAIYGSVQDDREITIIFKNCRFAKFGASKDDSSVKLVFENCTFKNFKGSNASFNWCAFTEGGCDGLNPYGNVVVKNSYFYNMTSNSAGDGIHVDGTQIYGYAGIDADNIWYDNCRFEVPALTISGSTSSVNACIMLQLEYSNANNFKVTNCLLNGGGFAIYAHGVKGYEVHNVLFENIQVGFASLYGVIATKTSDEVKYKNITRTSHLYVSNVEKRLGNTYIVVTNDTDIERTIRIITDKNTYVYNIPAFLFDSNSNYMDLPIDIELCIPEDCSYVVCMDDTTGEPEQVRFVNWSEKNVYISRSVLNNATNVADKVILEGACGIDAYFTLTQNGVLTIDGKGKTDSYNSGKLPPWENFKTIIKNVVVNEGITSLGNQMFNGCTSLSYVSLPETLVTIGGRVFYRCEGVVEYIIPASVISIGDYNFNSALIQRIIYFGNTWDALSVNYDNIFAELVLASEIDETSGTKNSSPVTNSSLTATNTPTPTATNTPTPTATNTPVPTATNMPTPTATNTPVPTATNTPTPTVTNTPVPTATNTPTPTVTNTPTPTATNTPVPTATNTPVPTATNTPVPTATNTPVPTATNTPVPTATNTPVPTATSTPVPTATNTPVPTATNTPTPTATNTPTPKPTVTKSPKPNDKKPTPTVTSAPTNTPTPTPVVNNGKSGESIWKRLIKGFRAFFGF